VRISKKIEPAAHACGTLAGKEQESFPAGVQFQQRVLASVLPQSSWRQQKTLYPISLG